MDKQEEEIYEEITGSKYPAPVWEVFIEKLILEVKAETKKEIIEMLETWKTDEIKDDPNLSEWGKGKRVGFNKAIEQIISKLQ